MAKSRRPSVADEFEKPVTAADDVEQTTPPIITDLGEDLPPTPDSPPDAPDLGRLKVSKKGFSLLMLTIVSNAKVIKTVKGKATEVPAKTRRQAVPLKLPKDQWPYNANVEYVRKSEELEYSEAERDAILASSGWKKRDPLALNDAGDAPPSKAVMQQLIER